MADDDGLSIEETNKLRVSLGLKPLKITTVASEDNTGDKSSNTQDEIASNNFNERRETEARDKKKRDIAERLRKARERAERDRRIGGKTLADDSGEEDTLDWIRRTKSAPKNRSNITKLQEAPQPIEHYTTQDLRGLRVGHDSNEFVEGGDVVLTLRDGDVLDDDAQDELVNVELDERQALKSRLANKKRKSVYTTYEDDNDVDENTGERKILGRYDEDVDAVPKRQSGFVIDSEEQQQPKTKSVEVHSTASKRILVSLEQLSTVGQPSSDYAEPIKMKKSKKKKQLRKSRSDHSNVDHTETRPTTNRDHIEESPANLVDDDDLQASLAKQRRLAAQERIRRLASLNSEINTTRDASLEPSELQDAKGLVLDETTEFTRGLQDIKVVAPRIKHEHASPEEVIKAEIDQPMPDAVDIKEEETQAEISTTGIQEEATFDQGVGAAMAMLRQKGVLKSDGSENSAKQSQEAWLAKNKKVLIDLEIERRRVREELRNSPKYKNMSVRDREALAASENRRLDAIEAKAAQERFRDYKPNIEIKYVDDFGRNMNQKEAFKHMSHQFHGKDSGSGKTAKKLAQIEKEKTQEQRSLFK